MSVENNKSAVVYGKSNCPYCELAKKFLTQNNYEVNYINLDDENARKDFYSKTTNELGSPVMSVPQIWISNKYVGGYSDLVKYINSIKSVSFDEDF